MTDTPIIVIPAHVAAGIAETHARKQREYEEMLQQIAEQAASRPERVSVAEPVELHLADDVGEAATSAVTELFDTYYADDDQPIDWDSFWDRLERTGFVITQGDSPAAMKIRRIVRRLRDAL
jgi:elongation factor P--beta-lysine ligase